MCMFPVGSSDVCGERGVQAAFTLPNPLTTAFFLGPSKTDGALSALYRPKERHRLGEPRVDTG